MKVSVVIPSYNHREYVVQAIESALEQSWPEIDLIVIDDGSTDGSPEVIQRLFEARGGFRFIARENRGLVSTLQQGLEMARGEFFCELASDDFLPANSLQARTEFLEKNPECVAVFGDGVHVEGDNPTEERILKEKHRRLFELPAPIPEMLSGTLPVFSTGLIRKETLMRCGGFDTENFRFYEDLDTPVRLALEGRFGFLDKPLIFRRMHKNNISTSTSHIRREKVLCYLKFLKEPALVPYHRLIRRRLRSSLINLTRHMKRSGGSEQEREVFVLSWREASRDIRLYWYFMKWGKFRTNI